MNILHRSTPAGRINVVTLDTFLQALKVKTVEGFGQPYNQQIGHSQPVARGLQQSTYQRAIAYLKNNPSNFKESLMEHLRKVVSEETTLEAIIEDASVESMKEFGFPDYAVLVDGHLLILNSKDFEVWIKFDESGQVFGAVPCFNTMRNLQVLVDWSTVNLNPSGAVPEGPLKERLKKAEEELAQALGILDKLKKTT